MLNQALVPFSPLSASRRLCYKCISGIHFFTGQDIRRGQAAAAEDRLTISKTAEENRALQRTAGQEARAQTAETGLQYRRGLETAGEQDRALTRETGKEQRTTDLQREMFRRYKENRDFEQAQSQYRT